MVNNMFILLNYLKGNPELKNKIDNRSILIDGNTINYEGVVIDLNGFDVESFFENNYNLQNDLAKLSGIDVINIIKLHADYSKTMQNGLNKSSSKNEQSEEEAKAKIEAESLNNPALNKFIVFKNLDFYGTIKSFVKCEYMGEYYVFEDVSAADFLENYEAIKSTKGAVSEADLFKSLASKYKKIDLENSFEAERRVGVSEEHLNNMKNLERQNIEHLENHNVVLGNEKYGIYINNGDVIPMGHNSLGNKVIEVYSAKNSHEEGELGQDALCKYDEQQLISFEEYRDIIVNRESINNEEQVKISNFENFLFSIMVYKNYLTPELREVYENFSKLWEYLINVKETTEVIETAKYRYQNMQSRSETVELVNVRSQITKLTRQLDSSLKAGYVNALLYVGVILFVGIVIAVITVLAK